MVIDLILAVLAVNISGTGPSTTTYRTPLESARRDERSPRARASDMTAVTHRTLNNIMGADQHNKNSTHSSPRAPHTPHLTPHTGWHATQFRPRSPRQRNPSRCDVGVCVWCRVVVVVVVWCGGGCGGGCGVVWRFGGVVVWWCGGVCE